MDEYVSIICFLLLHSFSRVNPLNDKYNHERTDLTLLMHFYCKQGEFHHVSTSSEVRIELIALALT